MLLIRELPYSSIIIIVVADPFALIPSYAVANFLLLTFTLVVPDATLILAAVSPILPFV